MRFASHDPPAFNFNWTLILTKMLPLGRVMLIKLKTATRSRSKMDFVTEKPLIPSRNMSFVLSRDLVVRVMQQNAMVDRVLV